MSGNTFNVSFGLKVLKTLDVEAKTNKTYTEV